MIRRRITAVEHVQIPTLKIWNWNIGTSQYRTDDHGKLSRVRSADRRKRPRPGSFVPRWSPGRGCTCSMIQLIVTSAKVAARIVGMSVAPLLHQFLEFGVTAIWQHDARGDEQ